MGPQDPRGQAPSSLLPQDPAACAPTCGLENPRVAQAVALGKGFHHPINLLGFSREAEAPEELPASERGRVSMPGLAGPAPHSQSP